MTRVVEAELLEYVNVGEGLPRSRIRTDDASGLVVEDDTANRRLVVRRRGCSDRCVPYEQCKWWDLESSEARVAREAKGKGAPKSARA